MREWLDCDVEEPGHHLNSQEDIAQDMLSQQKPPSQEEEEEMKRNKGLSDQGPSWLK